MPAGKQVETRQITILPLEGTRKGGEPVLLAALIVNSGMWSRTEAPALDWIKERYKRRPRVQKYRSHQQKGPVHLLVGRDTRNMFPEVEQEGCLRGDELFLCKVPFKPGQVMCGAAQTDLDWLERPVKPNKTKKGAAALGRAGSLPRNIGGDRRLSVVSSIGQSPWHGLHDETWGTGEITSNRGVRLLRGQAGGADGPRGTCGRALH
jgi:hypothetical protein